MPWRLSHKQLPDGGKGECLHDKGATREEGSLRAVLHDRSLAISTGSSMPVSPGGGGSRRSDGGCGRWPPYDPRFPHGFVEGALKTPFVEMMAPPFPGTRIGGEACRREDVLPAPLGCGARILPRQGVGQIDSASPCGAMAPDAREVQILEEQGGGCGAGGVFPTRAGARRERDAARGEVRCCLLRKGWGSGIQSGGVGPAACPAKRRASSVASRASSSGPGASLPPSAEDFPVLGEGLGLVVAWGAAAVRRRGRAGRRRQRCFQRLSDSYFVPAILPTSQRFLFCPSDSSNGPAILPTALRFLFRPSDSSNEPAILILSQRSFQRASDSSNGSAILISSQRFLF
jgi:hypothetical protein